MINPFFTKLHTINYYITIHNPNKNIYIYLYHSKLELLLSFIPTYSQQIISFYLTFLTCIIFQPQTIVQITYLLTCSDLSCLSPILSPNNFNSIEEKINNSNPSPSNPPSQTIPNHTLIKIITSLKPKNHTSKISNTTNSVPSIKPYPL